MDAIKSAFKAQWVVKRMVGNRGYAVVLDWERCPDGAQFGVASTFESNDIPTLWNWSDELAEAAPVERRRRLLAEALIWNRRVPTPNPYPGLTSDRIRAGLGDLADPQGADLWIGYRSEKREAFSLRAGEDNSKAVVAAFINASTPDLMLAFVSRFGIPVQNADRVSYADLERCRVMFHLHVAAATRETVGDRDGRDLSAELYNTLAQWGRDYQIAPSISPARGATGMVMLFRPSSLMAYMIVEAGVLLTGPSSPRRCSHCGHVFFAVHRSATYCSNRCRVARPRWMKLQATKKAARTLVADAPSS